MLCSQYLTYPHDISLIPVYLLHISRKIKCFILTPLVNKQQKQDETYIY